MSKNVLVVDDEAHILHVVSMKLRNAGYAVTTAMDGEEALELCRAEPPDLLITDYQMPLLSGVELCKALRRNEQTRDIPAIMLTARGFDIDAEETRQAGITVVLSKPFSPREMRRAVDDLLNNGHDARGAGVMR
ncbi:MAG: response regulator [Phycisphaerae bacterium]|nr:response regulator [Phycisphaerae bacterium]